MGKISIKSNVAGCFFFFLSNLIVECGVNKMWKRNEREVKHCVCVCLCALHVYLFLWFFILQFLHFDWRPLWIIDEKMNRTKKIANKSDVIIIVCGQIFAMICSYAHNIRYEAHRVLYAIYEQHKCAYTFNYVCNLFSNVTYVTCMLISSSQHLCCRE